MTRNLAFYLELKHAAIWFSSALGAAITVFTVNSFLPVNIQLTFPNFAYWFGFGLFPATAFVLRLLRSVHFLVLQLPADPELGEDVFEILLHDIREAHSSGRWSEVLRIGEVISRPLWIIGRLKLRTEIGKYVEAAASHLERYDAQARALIDDLGWTFYELGDVKRATTNINAGRVIAKDAGLADLVYKATRHLSGIAIFEGNIEDAEKYLNETTPLIDQIQDSAKKSEAKAGWRLNRGIFLLLFGDKGQEAENELRAAMKDYTDMGDRERAVKSMSYIGDALTQQNSLQEAKDTYRKGITGASKEGRLDAEMRCQLGLGKLMFDLEKDPSAKQHMQRAFDLANELGNRKTADDAEKYLKLMD